MATNKSNTFLALDQQEGSKVLSLHEVLGGEKIHPEEEELNTILAESTPEKGPGIALSSLEGLRLELKQMASVGKDSSGQEIVSSIKLKLKLLGEYSSRLRYYAQELESFYDQEERD